MCNLKKLLTAALIGISALSAQAASLISMGGHNHIKEAVRPALRVLRASYNVADQSLDNQYSAQDDTVFSRCYSLAIVVDGGLIVNNDAISPWNTDPAYNAYLSNPEYRTLINDRKISPLSAKAQYVEIDRENADFEPIASDDGGRAYLYYCTAPGLDTHDFLTTYTGTDDVNGFIVWAYIEEGKDVNKNTDLGIKIDTKKVNFLKSSTPVSPTITNGQVIGGIYVTPIVTSPGVVEFRLAGILTPPTGPGKSWEIVKASIPADSESPVADEPSASDAQAEEIEIDADI